MQSVHSVQFLQFKQSAQFLQFSQLVQLMLPFSSATVLMLAEVFLFFMAFSPTNSALCWRSVSYSAQLLKSLQSRQEKHSVLFEQFLHEKHSFSAFRAVGAVGAVRAVDVAVLIGDNVGGGCCSALVRHGFFSYKLVGATLPE